MLIIGAKGFAKEVLEILVQLKTYDDVYFYDDINYDLPNFLFDKYPILKSEKEVINLFEKENNQYTLGVGNPRVRKILDEKFSKKGGVIKTIISPFAKIGLYENHIGSGCNIMTSTIITSSVKIGKGCLINLNCTIGHDCHIGDYVELSPNVNVSGNCIIGDFTLIGTNAIILPNVSIGNNCIIGAGTLVNKNIPDNSVAVGVPFKIIRKIDK